MKGSSHRSIIHVDMDAFYASVEQADQPRYRDRPIIVGGLGRRGVVAAASYEARRFGVHSAMPMAMARRLCPQGIFLPSRMARYREISARIFMLFREVTPLVEGLSLDEAFLDVTGSIRLFGTAPEIGHRLSERIRQQTGLVASVGIAPNKFLAKLASDSRKPAGFVVVEQQNAQRFLDPMPVARLWGIGRKTTPRLKRLGILTVGQLRRADPEALQAVLGNRTGHFLALARGEDDRPVVPDRDGKSISHEVTFDQDLLDPRAMRSELQRQAEAVMHRVRGKGLAARTIHLKVRDRRFRGATRSSTLHAPTGSTRTVYRVAAALLGSWLADNANTPVRLLGVGVSGLEHDHQGPPDLDGVLDRVTARYGAGSVTGGLALGRGPNAKRSDNGKA